MPTPGQGSVLYLKETTDLLDKLAEDSGESRSTITRQLIKAAHAKLEKKIERRVGK